MNNRNWKSIDHATVQIIAGLLSTIDFRPSQHHPVQMEPMAKRIIRLLSEGDTPR